MFCEYFYYGKTKANDNLKDFPQIVPCENSIFRSRLNDEDNGNTNIHVAMVTFVSYLERNSPS